MKIKILRKDSTVELPAYQTPGSVAFDLSSSEDTVIQPHEIQRVPTGLTICTPPDHMLLIAARSSTPMKKGLMIANGIGIVDQDYCGPGDEIKLQLLNFTDKPVEVKKGERLAQGLFLKLDRVEWEEVKELNTGSRGGFGSTG